jgi:glyoxylase-like metal-dependent hydrolase (beta-lactamase superfamily II)
MMEEVLDDVYEIQMPRPNLPEHLVVSTDEPISCHLIDYEETILVGTGYAFSADDLIEQIDEVGNLDVVIIEHGDSDHFGALPSLLEYYDDVSVAIPTEDIGSLIRIYKDIPIDHNVQHGDNCWGLQPIEVSGHTPGNVSLIDKSRGILYVGDTFVGSDSDVAEPRDWSGAFAPPASQYSVNSEDSVENLIVLEDTSFDIALLTHGENVYANAKDEFMTMLVDLELA